LPKSLMTICEFVEIACRKCGIGGWKCAAASSVRVVST